LHSIQHYNRFPFSVSHSNFLSKNHLFNDVLPIGKIKSKEKPLKDRKLPSYFHATFQIKKLRLFFNQKIFQADLISRILNKSNFMPNHIFIYYFPFQ